MKYFVIGLSLHFLFLFSIFDIYFKSPIVKNQINFTPIHEPLASRLVLIIVDGLRAESFINHSTMVHVRSLANTHGRWGISNTRVPTESRPGHVAVIAGFYEDPSAVVKGWKKNPVDFDSVFNQSTYTWCWGAYDILQIFSQDSANPNIFVDDFDPYDDTFDANKNTTWLDSWVFERVKLFFEKASTNNDLKKKLMMNKIIFFLHLLGTDTSGHTHKPKSQNFLTTLKFVDEGVKKVENIIKTFYDNDGRTTFLLTSDHGMTDWGSHGAGLDHETQTPYVLWGAGVNQATHFTVDTSTFNMSLEHRYDVEQVDLTPLMSTLLSIPVPVNSVGYVPVDLLNTSLANKAKAVYSNARQMLTQYNKKRLDVEKHCIKMIYEPYQNLTEEQYKEILRKSQILLDNHHYEELIAICKHVKDLSLDGLEYYHKYYQKVLLTLVTLTFAGWILCLMKRLQKQQISKRIEYTSLKKFQCLGKTFDCLFSCLGVLSVYIIYVQNLPIQYYLYTLTPIMLWWRALSSLDLWIMIYKHVRGRKRLLSICIKTLIYSLGSLVLGQSFHYRWALSIPLFGMSIWPFLSRLQHQLQLSVLLIWTVSCILLSSFSFMPVVGKDVFVELVLLAGLIWILALIFYMRKILLPLYYQSKVDTKEFLLTFSQIVLLTISLENIYTQSKRFETGISISYSHQFIAWSITVTSLFIPFLSTKRIPSRLMTIYTSLLNIYLLMSVSHEGIFVITLILNITCWLCIEHSLVHNENLKHLLEYTFEESNINIRRITGNMMSDERGLIDGDFRRSFFFITYVILAFFGTGNIASLNSFEVRWVTCFITSFKPFLITTLILAKTLMPFLCVACAFKAVQYFTKAPIGYMIIIVLVYSNIMGIQSLYYVKNTGSWLDIGTSISQFVIVQVITIFIVIINEIAKLLTHFTFINKSVKKYV